MSRLCLAVASTFALAACQSAPPPAPPAAPTSGPISAEAARQKLQAISKNDKQLWVVVHIRANKTQKADGSVDEAKLFADALANADAVVQGGGDMIVLINSRTEMPLYERVIAAVREKYPEFPLGISALDYGPRNLTEGFRLAQKFKAQMVWCETVPDERMEFEEDDGRYTPAEVIPLELALTTQRTLRPEAIHAAGVHMKYTRPLDGKTFEEAMSAALGKVDAINITGPKTAVLADIERVRTARRIAGSYPLGLASGVSVENIAEVVELIDYAIVGTSLKMEQDPLRTDVAKVRALREKMTALSRAPKAP